MNIPTNTYPKPYAFFPILSTLIACLSNESKNLLYENGISIRIPTPKSPLFNYISFIKALSFYNIEYVVGSALNSQQINTSKNKYLVIQELLKAFMIQISSLKSLNYNISYSTIIDIPFVSFRRAKDCLTDLLEFKCVSDYYSNHQLSQICHNIQSLSIMFNEESNVSNGLKELICSQNHLKSLGLNIRGNNWKDIIPFLTKHHDTLTRLHVQYISIKEMDYHYLLHLLIYKNLLFRIFTFTNYNNYNT